MEVRRNLVSECFGVLSANAGFNSNHIRVRRPRPHLDGDDFSMPFESVELA